MTLRTYSNERAEVRILNILQPVHLGDLERSGETVRSGKAVGLLVKRNNVP
jgi:hypothetical protein